MLSGSVTMYGSNVTVYDERGKLVVPSKDKFVKIDSLSMGITANDNIPEWVYFTSTGDTEIWARYLVDCRITPVEVK